MPRKIQRVGFTWGCKKWTIEDAKCMNEILLPVFARREAQACIFQAERGKQGEEDGYVHFHMAILFKEARTWNEHRAIIQEFFTGAHIEKTIKSWNKWCNYCQKDDTRLLPTRKMNSKMMEDFQEADETEHFQPIGWQKGVIEYVKDDSNEDDRTIPWIYDAIGKHGKTKLARHLHNEYGALMLDWCEAKDAQQYIAEADDKSLIVFNFSRTKSSRTPPNDLYKVMENCIDGYTHGLKWHSGYVQWNYKTKVIVFANFKPDMTRLSQDRWDIIDISDEPQMEKPGMKRKRISDFIEPHLKRHKEKPSFQQTLNEVYEGRVVCNTT